MNTDDVEMSSEKVIGNNVDELELLVRRSLTSRGKKAIIMTGPEGNLFCCAECPMNYENKQDLELHLCTHNSQYRHLCGICGAGLKRREHLDRHMLEHKEMRPFICPECGKGFKRKEHLTVHSSIHTTQKTEICPFCQRSFHRKDHLRKHMHNIHEKEFVEDGSFSLEGNSLLEEMRSEIVELEELNPSTIKSELLQENIAKTFLENISTSDTSFKGLRPFVCSICHKSYKRKDHLKIHSACHLKKDKICTKCNKAFHWDEQLEKHMAEHRVHEMETLVDGSEDENPCLEIDDGTSIRNSSFNDTNQDLIEESVRPYVCHLCNKRFKRKAHLQVHTNVHMRIEQFFCSQCSKGFYRKDHYTRHKCVQKSIDSTHNPEEVLINDNYNGHFLSDLLNQQFNMANSNMIDKQNCTVKEETNATSNNDQLPKPQKVFVCKVCSKPFRRRDHYKIHLNIHTGIKTMFCPECGKGFYRKDHMQKHMIVHSKSNVPKSVPPVKNFIDFPSKIRPEITIHAPSNLKLRVPLQINVPYKMIMSMENGEQKSVTVAPHCSKQLQEL